MRQLLRPVSLAPALLGLVGAVALPATDPRPAVAAKPLVEPAPTPVEAKAGRPRGTLLRIAYSGNGLGEFDPCG